MEPITKDKDWISAHLFYTNFNALLKYAVHPFIIDLEERNLIESYFFIRYWEKGPHIRLRLLVSVEKVEEVVNLIKSYFEVFFDANPSVRNATSPNLLPNNSVQFIDYIPETERYGGEHAIAIAERHFQDSSDTVLKLLESYDNWSISLAQGKALQLYVVFFKAITLSKEEKRHMLEIMKNSQWKTKAQLVVGNENIDEIFAKQYLKNEASIKVNVENLNAVIDSGVLSDFPLLYDFFTCVQKTDQKLDFLGERELLLSRKDMPYDANLIKRRIYISYLHMLNNRLGLNNEDEAYLSFLMEKVINF